MKKLCLFIFSLLLIFAAGCQLDTSEIDRETELEYITVDTSEAKKLTYHIGDVFDPTGIRIWGHYSNGYEKEEDVRLASFPDVDTSVVNPELYVDVIYNKKSASFPIVVQEVMPASIKVVMPPKKIVYTSLDDSDEIDLDGIVVDLEMSDGSIVPIEDLSSFSAQKLFEDTQYFIMLNYNHTDDLQLHDKFPIWVTRESLNTINILNNKGEEYKGDGKYRKGTEINFDYKIDLIFSGSTQKFDMQNCNYTISPNDLTTEGTKQITINVNNEQRTFDITVVDGYVVGAMLDTKKTTFYDGETVSFYGAASSSFIFKKIIRKNNTDTYADGDEEFFNNIRYSYNSSNNKIDFTNLNDKYDKATPIQNDLVIKGVGPQKIYFYYNYFDEYENINEYKIFCWEYDIGVVNSPLKSIKATYNQNTPIPLSSELNLDLENQYGNWEIQGIFYNTSNTPITIDPQLCDIKPKHSFKVIQNNIKSKPNNVFKERIDISYTSIVFGKLQTFNDYVEINFTSPTHTGVNIISAPTKTVYNVGETLDLDGLKLGMLYSDGSTEPVKYTANAGWLFSFSENDSFSSSISFTTSGIHTIYLKYNENYMVQFKVTVLEHIPLYIDMKPTEDRIYSSISDLINNSKYNIYYKDGTSTTYNNSDFSNLGITKTQNAGILTFTYQENFSQNINVSQIFNSMYGIKISQKRVIYASDNISFNDFTVKANYYCGQKDINDGAESDFSYDNSKRIASFSYNGFTATCIVTITQPATTPSGNSNGTNSR